MFKRLILVIAGIIGVSFGANYGAQMWKFFDLKLAVLSNMYLNSLVFAFIFILFSWILYPLFRRLFHYIQEVLNRQTAVSLFFGTIGGIVGLLIGFLMALPLAGLDIPFLSNAMPLVISIILAIVGYQTASSRADEWKTMFARTNRRDRQEVDAQVLERKAGDNFHKYKLLDTSVIIDGRIADIVRQNFIEGVLVIPNFVLQELQYIADSSDALKRARGRRGLDILNAMQKEALIPIEMYDGDFEDIGEVDSKLIRLAKLIDAAIITNDYNLNKVCEFQNVRVFNINALANAVKPVVIPGEVLEVMVIKPGTERKQGVAYLQDGTMIVIEDGQHYMNEELKVVVTSALQTAAGRMIFARPLHAQTKLETQENKESN